MTLRVGLVAAATAPLLAALSACISTDSTSPSVELHSSKGSLSVDVATAPLRALRARAGIQDCPQVPVSAPVAEGLPELALPCLGGGPDVTLSSLRGTPLVLNLWASWCGPCRDELPFFQRLHERAGRRLAVLGVDIDDREPGRALALAIDTGVTYPLLADPDALLRAPLRVMALPQTVLVAGDGRVVAVERNVMSSYDQLLALVQQHLGVAA